MSKTSFIDKAQIKLASGSGGNGMVAWRREKFVEYGGPAGGDGGNGGDVYMEATTNLNTLLDFKFNKVFKAEDGVRGQSKGKHGKCGKDLTIMVPCGTVVRDVATGEAIADLKNAGDKVMVAKGGRGGRGNIHFLSQHRKAPHFAEAGETAVERELELELKLLADVGLLGLPNAGKSTFISSVSAAKPKIADYPFTTLAPNLGVVKKPNGDGIVIADIPGLVEGASDGVGLGHEFLRHVERNRLLLHLVDISHNDDPVNNYHLINNELKRYSAKLYSKPQLVVLTKTDATDEELIQFLKEEFSKLTQNPVFAISSVSRDGLDELLNTVFETLETLPHEETLIDIVEEDKGAYANDDSAFEVIDKGIEQGIQFYEVIGGRIYRLLEVTDMDNHGAVRRLMNILKSMGVYKELKKLNAKEGDRVLMNGIVFDYYADEDFEDENDEENISP